MGENNSKRTHKWNNTHTRIDAHARTRSTPVITAGFPLVVCFIPSGCLVHYFLQVETKNRCMPREGQRECPGWYRLKLFFEGLKEKAAARGGTFLSLTEVCESSAVVPRFVFRASLRVRACVSVYLSACLPVCLSLCLSVRLSLCLSCLFYCASQCFLGRSFCLTYVRNVCFLFVFVCGWLAGWLAFFGGGGCVRGFVVVCGKCLCLHACVCVDERCSVFVCGVFFVESPVTR